MKWGFALAFVFLFVQAYETTASPQAPAEGDEALPEMHPATDGDSTTPRTDGFAGCAPVPRAECGV